MDVSICMPYFERSKALKITMDSFDKCGYFLEDYPCKVEVSICDDGSIRDPAPEGRYNLCHTKKKKIWLTPCIPINKAVKNSSGRVILLQSPETYHPSPIIHLMYAMVKGVNDVVMVACKYGSEWKTHPDIIPNNFWWCQMITRKFYESIDGFDESFRNFKAGEDNDFAIRLKRAGANWKWLRGNHVVHGWIMKDRKRLSKSAIPKLRRKYGKNTPDLLLTHIPQGKHGDKWRKRNKK